MFKYFFNLENGQKRKEKESNGIDKSFHSVEINSKGIKEKKKKKSSLR